MCGKKYERYNEIDSVISRKEKLKPNPPESVGGAEVWMLPTKAERSVLAW